MTDSAKSSDKIKLIYNPKAGKKRLISDGHIFNPTIEDIKGLFHQYEIDADFFPTKSPGHATILARESIREGYSTVIAAGGGRHGRRSSQRPYQLQSYPRNPSKRLFHVYRQAPFHSFRS